MTFNQVIQLRSYVEVLPRPDIKEYVWKLTEENIIASFDHVHWRPGEGEMVSNV